MRLQSRRLGLQSPEGLFRASRSFQNSSFTWQRAGGSIPCPVGFCIWLLQCLHHMAFIHSLKSRWGLSVEIQCFYYTFTHMIGEQEGGHHATYDLVSGVTNDHFCHFYSGRRKSFTSPHSRGEEGRSTS